MNSAYVSIDVCLNMGGIIMGNIKNYYAGSNSSVGFYSMFDEALKGLSKLWILKGGPGTGKSSLMKKIGAYMEEQNYNIEYIHCSSDNGSIDGVIIPELKLGMVDGTAPHIIDPKYPGIIDEIINLGEYRDDSLLQENSEDIISLTNKISDQFKKAYQLFAEARKVHERKEEIYLSAMNFNIADEVIEKLKKRIFANQVNNDENQYTRRLFFGAATPEGPVNFIDNLTEGLNKRYLIKGRSGSGKSTVMKRVACEAEKRGLSVEYYHCAFDPTSIDMIIIPSLSVAMIDGTAPHVINPTRENDEVVDMFELCINPEIEVTREKEIKDTEALYKKIMQEGTVNLQRAKSLHDELEAYYVEAMDFGKVNDLTDQLIKKITASNI
jgi:Cdc6-like AAA superfamily ATPase